MKAINWLRKLASIKAVSRQAGKNPQNHQNQGVILVKLAYLPTDKLAYFPYLCTLN
jgi:hypothetical protein